MFARLVGWVCAVSLLAFALAGCQGSPGSSDDRPSTRASSGYGAVFLAAGECSSRGRASFNEVPCRSERAVARVLDRHDGEPPARSACPARTDFVLHISENRPAADENGDGSVDRGYACMRNLDPPHPGDPGGGGGPRTIVGDCLTAAGKGQVRETACAGTGGRAPQYRVLEAVLSRSACPPSTTLYVTLGGSRPVGCAVTV
ncbi:hypothetical protein OG785_23025 [Streptomyces sp. NBC_00006]|uniref:hypothetical protein n=1 Tax=Streptomyces sp. NBC_00006 TaxID=2975619 RepID=UPI0022525535|nr:hypothetical protein [Streptomyces sp. NBC_00006]MCX5533413.1 hypothetical protein [Streptomyces sp. NBC_00006]